MRRSPAPKRSLLRNAALLGALTLLAVLAFAPDAFANFFTPQSGGSPNANRIANLYSVTLYIAAVVFVGVEGTLLYTLVRFRKRKGRVAVQIHGNTRLEIGWTVGAAAILVALATVTFANLHAIRTPDVSGPGGLAISDGVQAADTGDAIHPPKGRYMTIQVNGQQYLWTYTYLGFGKLTDQLDDPRTSYQMYVPTNTTIVLKVVSQDVVHSWWIPDLGGKVQAVPGYVNWTLVQDLQAAQLLRPVLVPLRPRSRDDEGGGHGPPASAIHGVAQYAAEEPQGRRARGSGRPRESRGQVRRGRGREPVRS